MLSRTADHLFWLARYIERAENTVRALDLLNQLSSIQPNLHSHYLYHLIKQFGLLNEFNLNDALAQEKLLTNPLDILYSFCFDQNNNSSVLNFLLKAKENARAIRGAISNDLWHVINKCCIEWKEFSDQILELEDYLVLYDWLKARIHLYYGVLYATHYHDETFNFLNMGCYLERAENTARLLDSHLSLPESHQFHYLTCILKAFSALEIFNRNHVHQPNLEQVLNLLVFDVRMPRSLTHSLTQLKHSIEPIGAHFDKIQSYQALIGKLQSELYYSKVDTLFVEQLSNYLHDFMDKINKIAGQIETHFMWNLDTHLHH